MLHPASGTGKIAANARVVIRCIKRGCTNRPFYHIVVADRYSDDRVEPVIEQLGTYDCMTNEHNEKLVSLNYERIQYWLGYGADTSLRVKKLLGLAGFFPIHPTIHMTAWRNRRAEENKTTEMDEPPKEASISN